MVSEALISLNKLTKRFGSFVAVDDVSFSLNRGEVVGFLGPNGAGKSTTMRMATGFLTPTSGTVTVCGHDIITSRRDAQSNIGYLPEGGPLYTDMHVVDFLHFIANIRNINGSRRKERLDFVRDVLHLHSVWGCTIDTLSKGYKRRVALAQAILHDPDVLILDEPTDGLDPNQKFEVQKLIASISKDKAIIISTHILEEVEEICSLAMIIAHGKVVATGTPEELASQAGNHNHVIVEFSQPPEKTLIDKLDGIKNVASVEKINDMLFEITPKNKKAILEAVNNEVCKKTVPLKSIYVRSGSLNDAFRTITQPANVEV